MTTQFDLLPNQTHTQSEDNDTESEEKSARVPEHTHKVTHLALIIKKNHKYCATYSC